MTFRYDAEKMEAFNYATLNERFDANESLFLAEKLTAFESEVYKIEYEGYQYSTCAPVVSDGSGLQSVGYYERDKSGQASIIASGADDINNLNAKQKKNVMPVYHFAAKYGWDHFQLQEVIRSGIPLENDMAMDSRDAMELLLDDTFFDGNTQYNIPGLLSDANTVRFNQYEPGATAFNSMTPDDIIKKVSEQVMRPFKLSKRNRMANRYLCSVDFYTHISTTRCTDTNMTILQFLRANFPQLQFVQTDKMDRDAVLAGGSETGKTITLAYQADPRVLAYKVPVPFFQHPLERQALNYERIVTGDIAGVEIKNLSPFSIAAWTKA